MRTISSALAIMLAVATCDTEAPPEPMSIGGHILFRDTAGRVCGVNEVAVELIASDGQFFRTQTTGGGDFYDGNGRWFFANVPQGPATLLAEDSYDDFLSVERTFNVAPGGGASWRETFMTLVSGTAECPIYADRRRGVKTEPHEESPPRTNRPTLR